MDKIRIVVADDHAILREGIRALLNLYPDMTVIGEAEDGQQAIERVLELQPDVVLMDIAMPGLGGLEATLEIKKVSPQVKVLVLTQHDNREYLYRFLKAGAAGYVLKKAAGTELAAAIRAVHQGDAFLSPGMAPAVIEGYLKGSKEMEDSEYERLTHREKEVLKLVAEGRTNKEIAAMLSLSVKTVMGHRANTMEKLGLHNRTELVKFALRHGLINIQY